MSFCHLQGSYPQTPQIRSRVVGSVLVLVTSDNLWGHLNKKNQPYLREGSTNPIRSSDERIPPSDRSVQLSTYTEVH